MTRIAKCFVAIAVVSLTASSAYSQWGGFNGELVLNPKSGAPVNPTFFYDSTDGLFYIENNGPNGVIDSADNMLLQGDDVGFISFIIDTSAVTTVQPTLPVFGDGIAWDAPVIFNDSIQFSGFAIAGAFLPISNDPVAIFQTDPGLDVDDFRDSNGNVTIEVGINFTQSAPGNTLFSVGDAASTGAFRVVPEPGALSMILMAGLSLFRFRRR